MKNLTQLYNNDLVDEVEKLYLSFTVGESKYAIDTNLVVEIMKLPQLEYPQKLPNNIVGLLKYNNFTINVLDIRFYLDIKITPYSSANQVLIVKTDEAIFGLLINKVEDIISLESSKIEHFPFSSEDQLIDYLYHHNDSSAISMFNLYNLENILKKGVASLDIDILSLFPHDDESRYKLRSRSQAMEEKTLQELSKNIFSKGKFISFSLNYNTYCINLDFVRAFLKNSVITPIPCAPDYIAGLMTLRGDFVAVIDIKKFLNFSSDNVYDKNRVIIVEAPDFKVGFLVDEIFSIIEIPEELIDKHSHSKVNKDILCEVVFEDNLYTILDMKSILSDEKLYIDEKS